MAGDEEQPTERSHLLPHDPRLSIRDAETESIVSSHISKEEQLLRETAVGERLPYNDYTTIDWLHDLVSVDGPKPGKPSNAIYRSKMAFGIDSFTAKVAFEVASLPFSTPAKDGSRQHSLARLRLAWHSW